MWVLLIFLQACPLPVGSPTTHPKTRVAPFERTLLREKGYVRTVYAAQAGLIGRHVLGERHRAVQMFREAIRRFVERLERSGVDTVATRSPACSTCSRS
jgi:hypothetical protein